MTPTELSHTVLRAVRHAVDAGELRVEVPARASVTPPGPGGRGDYATPIALKLARPAGHPPLKVAEILRTHLSAAEGIGEVVVTPPGFLNITLQEPPRTLITEILTRGPRYGHTDTPTTPRTHLHAPNELRALVTMDTLARVLRSQGTPVHTSCDTRPTPEWTSPLDIEIDAYGPPEAPGTAEAPGPPEAPGPAETPGAPHLVRITPVPATPPHLPLGKDATRWALLHPAPHDHPHLTPSHLVQRETNPLFRVRYAYARTRALTRNAAALGFTSQEPPAPPTAPEPGVQAHIAHTCGTPARTSPLPPLHLLLADHPRVLTTTATHHTPHRLTHHLVAIADTLLPLLPGVLPKGEEKPEAAHRTRLALAEAAGAVLAGGLSLLGIDAPEHL
ncbi:ArgS-related anticodon-binding protein NrtL [Streptomyces sp. 4F14]|uniref:ArgS-related anticodon-binding protein NrtL n=1 Tax=Streptomyces sp. 4F14 TaxID=3394380 RepID=UPI003A877505